MNNNILLKIQEAQKKNTKLLAMLLDPDKLPLDQISGKLKALPEWNIDFIFVGGSLLFTNILDSFIREIKKNSSIPIVLFPGNALQISHEADAILFLQLVSGRNPEYLIGNQVIAAPILKQTSLEIIPTGYILVESGRETTASYMSNTKPIPSHKPEIAMATALASQYLGHQLVYLDGGSGALQAIPTQLIELLTKNIDIPIIVGGGIQSKTQLKSTFDAGATLVVIGTAFENETFQ